MIFKSIRSKIILWYMLVLALTLFVFSLVLYHNLNKSLYRNIDDLLRSRAEGVISSIDTYWETEKLEIAKDGGKEAVYSKINNEHFAQLAQDWVDEKSTDPALVNITVQIYDINGRNIASSQNIPESPNFKKNIADLLLTRKAHYDTFDIALPDAKPLRLRTMTMPEFENGRIAYLVQVGSPLTSISASLNRLQAILFILLPLTVFLTGIVGAFLAKKTLSPVDEMIATIHQITAENLKQKIGIPRTNDEIQRLAETFNDMLDRLADSFTTQQQFIQDLSHELKTPLTVIKGELEVTLKKLRSPADYETVLISSLEEIDKLTRLTENLLMLARMENKEIVLEKKPVDLNVLIAGIADDLRILAEQKQVRLEYEPRPQVNIMADPAQLRRVFLNLLDNAIKYTPSGGRVCINLEPVPDRVRIAVSDTGVGIPANELKNIFHRFYRSEKTGSDIGFGLGLSIANSIILALHGSIEVNSAVGKGSTFTVILPLSSQL